MASAAISTQAVGPANAAAPGSTASCIDRLYARPSLIGEPPRLVAWSADGAHLAFVRSQDGRSTGDIWIYSPTTGESRRISRFVPHEPGDWIEGLAWLDAGRMVFVRQGALHSIDVDGQTKRLAVPARGVTQIGVASGTGRIAFAAEDGLWILPAAARGDLRRVYEPEGDRVSVESFKWSGDGGAIAFVVADDRPSREITIPYVQDGKERFHRVTRSFPGDETTHRHIGVFDIADGALRWLDRSEPKDPIWSYEWSRQGRILLVDSSNFLATSRRITAHDTENGTSTVHYSSEENGRYGPYWSAAWAPNDDGLVILSDHEGFYHLYHQRQPAGALRRLTEGSWEIDAFQVDAGNARVYFTANRDHVADRQIYRVSLSPGSKVEKVSSTPGTYAPSYSPTFEHVAFTFSNDLTPPDLYQQALENGQSHAARRITTSPGEDFERFLWADVRYIEFKSHVDGTPLYGRLYVPRGVDLAAAGKPYPLIVGSVYSDTVRNNWGGRSVHPIWGLDQCLVAGGYLVVNVNVRGSWGQGRAFREARREFGSLDVDDLESAVRHLVAMGHVDPARVGIWGSSYGGLMTTMSLFRKPDVYAAGIAGAPATNVWHAFPGEMRVMGEPFGEDYPERYRRQSSLYYADGLQDPMMIIHGTKDDVVLYSDSIALAERLIAAHKNFEFVTLPGNGHPWDNEDIETTRFAFRKMVEFFDRHLKQKR